MGKTGRPRTEINADQFRDLCKMQCTLEEIAGFFHCSADTIERWCKREEGLTFADAFKKYGADGKITLRRYQLRLAEKNASMAIWLGKQWLKQRDLPEEADPEDLRRVREILEGIESAIN